MSENIRKFEKLGTRSFPIEMSIEPALELHNLIGAKRKQERLQYLKNYWVNQLLDLPGFILNTSLKPEYACGIANFSLQNKTPYFIEKKLFDRYKIHAVATVWEGLKGVRISPNVYTNLVELDKLVQAIREIGGK